MKHVIKVDLSFDARVGWQNASFSDIIVSLWEEEEEDGPDKALRGRTRRRSSELSARRCACRDVAREEVELWMLEDTSLEHWWARRNVRLLEVEKPDMVEVGGGGGEAGEARSSSYKGSLVLLCGPASFGGFGRKKG